MYQDRRCHDHILVKVVSLIVLRGSYEHVRCVHVEAAQNTAQPLSASPAMPLETHGLECAFQRKAYRCLTKQKFASSLFFFIVDSSYPNQSFLCCVLYQLLICHSNIFMAHILLSLSLGFGMSQQYCEQMVVGNALSWLQQSIHLNLHKLKQYVMEVLLANIDNFCTFFAACLRRLHHCCFPRLVQCDLYVRKLDDLVRSNLKEVFILKCSIVLFVKVEAAKYTEIGIVGANAGFRMFFLFSNKQIKRMPSTLTIMVMDNIDHVESVCVKDDVIENNSSDILYLPALSTMKLVLSEEINITSKRRKLNNYEHVAANNQTSTGRPTTKIREIRLKPRPQHQKVLPFMIEQETNEMSELIPRKSAYYKPIPMHITMNKAQIISKRIRTYPPLPRPSFSLRPFPHSPPPLPPPPPIVDHEYQHSYPYDAPKSSAQYNSFDRKLEEGEGEEEETEEEEEEETEEEEEEDDENIKNMEEEDIVSRVTTIEASSRHDDDRGHTVHSQRRPSSPAPPMLLSVSHDPVFAVCLFFLLFFYTILRGTIKMKQCSFRTIKKILPSYIEQRIQTCFVEVLLFGLMKISISNLKNQNEDHFEMLTKFFELIYFFLSMCP
ncbi:zinc finger protein [Reticulomyxa filosa]|uniref:Zinc finger protein n=1 Tax=Reticulomyxa filosa TaxID=46433 RepID=X6MDI4_RETFI|nr:zinc finger protein [Reticulomyxa filosa]|eukprot:ETO11731.1 zinc finger protein [Reticulomyxa filosa]